MKTAGIVSFFSSENYGAILQSVALQYKLHEIGIDGTYINYAPKIRLKGFRKRALNKIYFFVRQFLGYKERMIRTNSFKEKFLCRTSPIVDYKDIQGAVGDKDLFIVGSDQVWNPRWCDVSDGFYFLSFTEKSKYSYASSFGINVLAEKYKSQYFEGLGKFKSVSVREKTGYLILEDIGIRSKIVVDPTFLLSQRDWLSFFPNEAIVKSKYIFCYVMNGDDKTARYIHRFATNINRQYSNEYKIITVGDKEYKRVIPGYNLMCNAGPAEFLNLIYNASFVLTNSFHGTCFSVNFNKNFSVVLDHNNQANNRIVDLLSELSILDSLYYSSDNVMNCRINEIDYKLVNERLGSLKRDSIAYLKDICNENNK